MTSDSRSDDLDLGGRSWYDDDAVVVGGENDASGDGRACGCEVWRRSVNWQAQSMTGRVLVGEAPFAETRPHAGSSCGMVQRRGAWVRIEAGVRL